MNLIARLSAALVLLSMALPSYAQLYPEEYTVIHETHSGTFVNNWEKAVFTFSPDRPFHIELTTTPYIWNQTMETFMILWKDGVLFAVDDNNVFNAQHIKLFNLQPGDYTVVLTYGGSSSFSTYPANGPMASRLADGSISYQLANGYMLDREEYAHFRGPLSARERGDWGLDMVMTLVPEPSTYAMLLAGLGVAGVAIRRARRQLRRSPRPCG